MKKRAALAGKPKAPANTRSAEREAAPSGNVSPNTALRSLLVCFALAVATFTVFWPVRNNGFVSFDDTVYVSDNPMVLRGLTLEGVKWAFFEAHFHMWHPLTSLSHMLDVQLFGPNPGAHHLMSVLIHCTSSILLFLLLQRITRVFWPSAIVAALFALHPFRVESVAWAAERKDVLCTLFWMLTFTAYAWYCEKPGWKRYVVLFLTCVLGIMTKPMFVTFPFVLLLLDYWPLRRWQPAFGAAKNWDWATLRRLVVEKLPLFALIGVLAVFTYRAQAGGGAVHSVAHLPLDHRAGNAIVSYARYLKKMIWPMDLAVIYPHPGMWPWAIIGLAGAIVIAITVLVIRQRSARPWLAVGWCWYLGTLTPVLGIVQVGPQSMADRYTYVPLIGIFIAIVWTLADWATKKPGLRQPLAALAVMIIGACMVLSRQQVAHWKNSETLFTHALRVTKENRIAHNNLGAALVDRGATDEAFEHYREAVRIDPYYDTANANLGIILAKRGDTEGAIKHYRAALSQNPRELLALNSLGLALASQGKYDEAIQQYEAVLKVKPDHLKALNNLALALDAAGRTDEAIRRYQEAIKLDPGYAVGRANLGSALSKMGRLDEALNEYKLAIHYNPNLVEARLSLAGLYARMKRHAEAVAVFENLGPLKQGNADVSFTWGASLAELGRDAEALTQFRESLRLRPDRPATLSEIARLLASSNDSNVRNGAEALKVAERCNSVARAPSPVFMDTLAMAFAEAGRMADAVRTAEAALQLAREQNRPEVAAGIEKRLALYRTEKPYRKEP